MKRFTLSIINALGWLIIMVVSGFTIISIDRNFVDGDIQPQLKTTLLLLSLLWIFIGTRSKDFTYIESQSYFRMKHYFMLAAIVFNLSDKTDFILGALPFILMLLAFKTYKESKIVGLMSGNWHQSIDKALPLEAVLKIINEKSTAVEVVKKRDTIFVKAAVGLFYEVHVSIFQDRTDIQVCFQSSSLIFLLGWKILPIPLGTEYGKKFRLLAVS